MSKLQSVVDKFGKWKHVDMDRLQYNLNRKQSDLHRVVAHEAKAEQRQRISATQYEKMTAQWKKKIKEEEALVQELNSKLKRLEAREGFGSITAAGGGSAGEQLQSAEEACGERGAEGGRDARAGFGPAGST